MAVSKGGIKVSHFELLTSLKVTGCFSLMTYERDLNRWKLILFLNIGLPEYFTFKAVGCEEAKEK